jgi:DNA-binding CsgD family transcriptional regulator
MMNNSEGRLTPREMDVLRLLAQGFTNKKIAERLAVNERTIKYHVSSILAKLRSIESHRGGDGRRAAGFEIFSFDGRRRLAYNYSRLI